MTSIQNSAQLFGNFLDAASQNKEVVLEKTECQAAPAKTGFLSRLVNWLSGGESTRKIHVDTRQAFMAAIQNAFGAEVAQMCLKELKFQPASKAPLSSREIRDVAALVASDKAQVATHKALDKVVRNFARQDELFRSGRDAFAKVRYTNSRQQERFQRDINAWVKLKDKNYDDVAAMNLQMENMRKLREGL